MEQSVRVKLIPENWAGAQPQFVLHLKSTQQADLSKFSLFRKGLVEVNKGSGPHPTPPGGNGSSVATAQMLKPTRKGHPGREVRLPSTLEKGDWLPATQSKSGPGSIPDLHALCGF